jgi:hypothetical protein
MTIDDYIAERNKILLSMEDTPDADRCWVELGVANRHIGRVLDGTLRLEAVEAEINQCFRRVRKTFNMPE